MELTQEKLKKFLRYEPETGEWFWLVSKNGRVPAGTRAGILNRGYLCIGLDRKIYKAHRLAWLYMTGKWPKEEIDHINLDKADNRWCNLREANRSGNNANTRKRKNNKSGYKGVCWHSSGRWRAQISVNGKVHYIGLFSSKEEAYERYISAAKISHKEFARAA